ncbi:MAG: tRNA pseudouridine(38-40) synthase TruA [bacterium]|nr:tRNA pseudouridine(38-40) synthase TruA [bacterium]
MTTQPSSRRRIKLILEYNGARYHGWQVQPNMVTVQGAVETWLSVITNDTVRLHAAGRTDAGVHAFGQVAHFDTPSTISLPDLQRGLNRLLPEDIVVRQVLDVGLDFHSQYAAKKKTYTYIVYNHPLRSVFRSPFTWHIRQPLDVSAMREAAQVLVGRHDFSAFRAASCTARNPVRCLERIAVKRRAQQIFFVLRANGFLQHMVRNIVGTLVAIGRGKMHRQSMLRILKSGQRQLAGPTAPPHGLFMIRIQYDN